MILYDSGLISYRDTSIFFFVTCSFKVLFSPQVLLQILMLIYLHKVYSLSQSYFLIQNLKKKNYE